jgi:hypothetical protein
MRVFTALALTATAALALSACADGASPAPAASSSSTPSATPSTGPTSTPSPTASITPVDIDCDVLVPAAVMTEFKPNAALSPSFEPEAGTEAADIVKLGGVACGWIEPTSGELIEVAVAHLTDEQSTALKNNYVLTSNAVPTYGDPQVVEGYFSPPADEGEAGQAEAFVGPYWISADSVAFFEPGDVATIMESAIAALETLGT